MSRKPLIAANWKMHHDLASAEAFVEGFSAREGVDAYLAAPYPFIHRLSSLCRTNGLKIGAQNMHAEEKGAFTGEVSVSMLQTVGAGFVILGHSERRNLFHETNQEVCAKLQAALRAKMPVIFCVGENLEEREGGQTEERLRSQILESLVAVAAKDISLVTLAYEPVWAVGTGKASTAELAAAAHRYCRGLFADSWGQEVADKLRILYGGSVKPENVDEFLAEEEIDGVLVGGASLSLDSFHKLIHFQSKKELLT